MNKTRSFIFGYIVDFDRLEGANIVQAFFVVGNLGLVRRFPIEYPQHD